MARFDGVPVEEEQGKKPRFAGVPVEQKKPAPKPANGRKNYGIFPWADPNAIGDFARAAWNNATDPIVGAVQFAANQDAKSGGALAKRWSNAVNDYANKREREYQAATPDNVPSYAGALVGGTVPFMFGPGRAGMEVAGNASRIIPAVKPTGTLANAVLGSASRNAQRAVGGSAQTGLYALVSPLDKQDGTTKEDQVKTAMIMGAALPVGIAAGARGYNGIKAGWDATIGNLTQTGADKRAAEVIRTAAMRPDELMRPQPSPIPGSQRSLAEETMDEGVAGLQNIFKNPAADDVRRDANNTARNMYLEPITGGSGSTYDDAIRAREANSAGVFDSARNTRFQVPEPQQPPLIALPRGMEYPKPPEVPNQMKPLYDSLEGIKAQYRNSKSGSVIQSYIDRIKAANGDGLQLDNIRRDIDTDMSNKGADYNVRDLALLKNALGGFLKENSPEFRNALTSWSRDSGPINRMDIGRALVAPASRGAAQDRVGYEVLKPQSFVGRVDNIDTVAQRATGFNRAKASDYLTPGDFNRIGNVTDDLNRQRFADTKGALFGSPTAQRINADKELQTTLLSQIPIAGKALKFLDDRGQERLKDTLAEVLLDPSRARQILASNPPGDRLVLENALRSMGWTGVLLGGGTR